MPLLSLLLLLALLQHCMCMRLPAVAWAASSYMHTPVHMRPPIHMHMATCRSVVTLNKLPLYIISPGVFLGPILLLLRVSLMLIKLGSLHVQLLVHFLC